jgi:membrane protein DedA with SNARE-associated domain
MPDGLLDWLTQIPPVALYLLMAVVAAVENVFPPIPADTVVAFGSWLAARQQSSVIAVFLGVWLGNVAGAAGMYLLGRRHGAAWIQRRLPSIADEKNERRLKDMYGRYGVVALMVSRFIPGVRAIVPPFAGALRIPMLPTVLAIATASGIWYGGVSYLAYRAGSDWEALTQRIAQSGRIAAIAAAAVAVVLGLVFWLRARRRGVEG